MVDDPLSLDLKIAKVFLFREHFKIVSTRTQTIAKKPLAHATEELTEKKKENLAFFHDERQWLLHSTAKDSLLLSHNQNKQVRQIFLLFLIEKADIKGYTVSLQKLKVRQHTL